MKFSDFLESSGQSQSFLDSVYQAVDHIKKQEVSGTEAPSALQLKLSRHIDFVVDCYLNHYLQNAPKYYIDSDEDGHHYILPMDKRKEWQGFVEDPEAWNPPAWAIPINGNPSMVTFCYGVTL